MRLIQKIKGDLWNLYVKTSSCIFDILRARRRNYYIRRILIYHNIDKNIVKRFRQHISYYVKNYKIVSLSEFIYILENHPDIEEDLITITFDDAYRSIYDYAAPILEEFGIKACIFVPVGFIEQKNIPTKYIRKNMKAEVAELPIKWEELKILVSKGYEIGSHSWNHIDFGSNRIDYERELLKSKQMLQKKLGCQVKYFSFPFGGKSNITQESLDKAKKYGYTKAFSGIRKNIATTRPFLLPRTYINPYWEENAIKYILYGYFDDNRG